MDNLLVVAMLGFLIISLFFGLIVGAVRGRKKAFIRLLTLVAAFLLALAFTPTIANMAGKQVLERLGSSYIPDTEFMSKTEIYDIIMKNYAYLGGIAFLLINPIVFIAVFAVFWLVSLVVFWILASIFGKRKRDEYGEKRPKGAFTGMLIGILCGFVMFLPTFIPINGYLAVVNELNKIEISGKPLMADVISDVDNTLENIGASGYSIDIEEYCDNNIVKAMGLFGLSDMCFDSLASTKIGGTKIVLREEIATISTVLETFDKLDIEKVLESKEAVDALEDFTFALLDSNLVIGIKDVIIDYLLENPDILDSFIENIKKEDKKTPETALQTADSVENSEANSENPLIAAFTDKEYIKSILVELKGDIRPLCEKMLNSLHDIVELEINFANFNEKSITSLNNSDLDVFIDAVFDVVIVRELLPNLISILIEPMAEKLGVSVKFTRPDSIDWAKEKTEIKKIFANIGPLMSLIDDTDAMNKMEDYFANKANAVAIGSLMEGLRNSALVNQLYYSMTAFDSEKDEYVFISYLNEMIFGEVKTDDLLTAETAPIKTLRPLFLQSDAIIVGATTNDNIDFEKFDWVKLFGGISDMFGLMKNVSNIQGQDFSSASKEDLLEILSGLEDMDKDMLKNVLDTIVDGIDLDITIPNLDGVDMKKESEIAEKLFDFQDLYNEKQEKAEEFTPEEINEIIDTLAESQFLLEMLDSSNTTVAIGDNEKELIETNLLSNETLTDEQKQSIINLFELGIVLGG